MALLLLMGSVGVSSLHLSPRSRAIPTLARAALVPTDRATTLAYRLLYFSPTYTPSSTYPANEAILAVDTPTRFAPLFQSATPTATETPEATATPLPPTDVVVSPLPSVTQLAHGVAVAEAPYYSWFVNAPVAASNPFNTWHNGVDVNVPAGTEVYAIAAGSVVCNERDWCGQIQIEHGGGLTSITAHTDERLVSCGQQVVGGQLIGRSGTLSCMDPYTTHPHTHLSILQNWNFVDPMTLYHD